MVQLKARLLLLLLLLLLTEAPLALLLDTCDGHADLSQEPTGHLSFTAGRGTGRTGGASLAVCTRTLEIPARHTARLKLVWLESGSNVSLACVLGTRERSLDVGDTALLSGCDRNRATLTWTGAGHSSNAFQLFYYVQEETRSTTATSPVPRSHPDVPASNPASTIERGPFSTTERGPLSAGADPSGNATRDPGLVQTAPFIDGEASSFPGEARNNGPETSAATARTDSPGTPDHFNTRRSIPTISNDETSTSAGPYTTSRPSGYEERKGPSMSSVESSDSESTSSRQNPHATVENKVQDLTENSQSIGTPAAESARTQREELLEGSSSARSESSHSTGRLWGKDGSAIASTANPRTMTKSELQDVTHEVRQPGSGKRRKHTKHTNDLCGGVVREPRATFGHRKKRANVFKFHFEFRI
ncbi:uncharacterized protein [Eucyclogobius newberryi]|uniref:uncharacterized protein n=1 Tax=Eucyclogobius newberryi TaxID=166745 RepID=UPI003B5C0346